MLRLLSIIFLWMPVMLIAQISVPSEVLPVAGDTFRIMVDNLPEGISPGDPGPSQQWDFSSLQAPFVQQTVYRESTDGMVSHLFPDADLMTQQSDNLEVYFDITDDGLRELGLYGEDPFGIGLSLVARYSEPYVVRRAPLEYLDQFTQNTSIAFPVDAEILPDSILQLFPIQPDSIRLRVVTETEEHVDAWGSVFLGLQSFDVLRMRSREVRRNRIDVKAGFFPWQDITDLVAALVPGLATVDTTFVYSFYDEMSREPLVRLAADSDEIVFRAEFKAQEVMVGGSKVFHNGARGIFVYPNPTDGMVRFDFVNLDPGRYHLKVMNILGVPIWDTTEIVDGDKTIRADLTFLRRGTYLYALTNDHDKRLFTKRLVIVKP